MLIGALTTEPGENINHRVVLKTVAGDIVLTLYPHIAPINCDQMIGMIGAGYFSGTHFHRAEKDFVLQHAGVLDRIPPLPAEYASKVRQLPAERSGAKHVRGVISMAREDRNPNSATSSFSIILNNAPHLDNNYTIIGELTHGWDVVDLMMKVPTNGTKPLNRLTVYEAWYVPPQQPLPKLMPAQEAMVKNSSYFSIGQISRERVVAVCVLATLIGIVGILRVVLKSKLTNQNKRSLLLLMVFISAFLICILIFPLTQIYQVVGVFLFLGLLSLFKLLGQFENAV